MKARQFALALAATLLTGATTQPPSSAPVLPNIESPFAAPSIGGPYKLTATYFLSQHADGRALTNNGYTSVVTFNKIKCKNTNGCNIGFNAMVQVLCRNTDSKDNYYGVDLYVVSEVNGTHGAVAPYQNPLFSAQYGGTDPEQGQVGGGTNNDTYNPIGAPFLFQNYQAVANGTTNSGAVQVQMVQTAGSDAPDCILGDWSVTTSLYSP